MNFDLVSTFTTGSAQFAATAEPGLGAGFYHSDGYAIPCVFGPVPPQRFVLLMATPYSGVSLR